MSDSLATETPIGTPAQTETEVRVLLWSGARGGQWACYEMLNGYVQRATVLDAHGDAVELSVEMFSDGYPVGLPAIVMARKDRFGPLDQAEKPDSFRAGKGRNVQAAGRVWSCTHVAASWQDEDQQYEQTMLFSADAPLSGLVLMELRADGVLIARQQLAAFGDQESSGERCP